MRKIIANTVAFSSLPFFAIGMLAVILAGKIDPEPNSRQR